MTNVAAEKILVALDVDTADDALRLAHTLKDHVGGFKVGLELVNAAGFDIFDRLTDAGIHRIFYDAKFHDIPNTVAGAVRAAARRGVWMVNVHTSGGAAMLNAAQEAAQASDTPPLLIGVTVLTSIDAVALSRDLRVSGGVKDHVAHLARMAQEAGLAGVVASPHEVAAIRETCGPEFLTVIPGVRPAGGDVQDQARVATPGETIRAGAHYLVVGRPITRTPDPAAAADAIAAEIADALVAQTEGSPS